MKLAIALLSALLLYAPIAGAQQCTTHTYFIDGKMIVCTTCCYPSGCYTTCI